MRCVKLVEFCTAEGNGDRKNESKVTKSLDKRKLVWYNVITNNSNGGVAMPKVGYRKPTSKSEVLQLRLTPAEKEMLFETADENDFDSVAEMLLTLTAQLKGEKICLTKTHLQS